MGPFIVDFYCSRARLVIELDGEQHASEQKCRDTRSARVGSNKLIAGSFASGTAKS
jgi:very-short-patch-repair endonuclease